MRQQNFKIFHRIENYVIELICAGDIFSVSLWHVNEEYLICELCDLIYTSSSFEALEIASRLCDHPESSRFGGLRA